jgi:hypothetical protein
MTLAQREAYNSQFRSKAEENTSMFDQKQSEKLRGWADLE